MRYKQVKKQEKEEEDEEKWLAKRPEQRPTKYWVPGRTIPPLASTKGGEAYSQHGCSHSAPISSPLPLRSEWVRPAVQQEQTFQAT